MKEKEQKITKYSDDEEDGQLEDEQDGIFYWDTTIHWAAVLPFFYYIKVGLKIDIPTCVPFILSFFFSPFSGWPCLG